MNNSFNQTMWNSSHVWTRDSILIFRFMHILHEYAFPVVAGFGLLSNCLSIVIFAEKKLLKSSTVYLIALLVSDTGFMFSLLWPYLESKGVQFLSQPGWCHVIIYLSYVCGLLSVWLIVIITVELYIVVCFPDKAVTFCSIPKAKLAVLWLFVLSLVLYSPMMGFVSTADQTCYRTSEVAWMALTYADTVITIILPYSILTVLLTCVARDSIKSLRRRLSSGRKKTLRQSQRTAKLKIRVAKMLFAISSSAFVMSVPSHVCRLRLLVLYGGLGITAAPSLLENFTYNVLLFVYQCSFGNKIFIFLLFSKNFRSVLKSKCRKCCLCLNNRSD